MESKWASMDLTVTKDCPKTKSTQHKPKTKHTIGILRASWNFVKSIQLYLRYLYSRVDQKKTLQWSHKVHNDLKKFKNQTLQACFSVIYLSERAHTFYPEQTIRAAVVAKRPEYDVYSKMLQRFFAMLGLGRLPKKLAMPLWKGRVEAFGYRNLNVLKLQAQRNPDETSGSNSCIGAKSGAMSSTFSLPHDHLHNAKKNSILPATVPWKTQIEMLQSFRSTRVYRSTGQTCKSRLREPHEWCKSVWFWDISA